MRQIAYLFTCFLCTVTLACRQEKVVPEPTAEPCATYAADIVYIVNSKCALPGCHVEGSTFGNFTLYSELKQRADNGRIQQFVFDLEIMPPASAEKLTDEEKEKLKCWLDDGAPDN